jgi:hypothetical protein
MTGKDQHNSDVGKDTDNDGRTVQPGHKAGEIDGNRRKQQQAQRSGGDVGKDTDNDGRVVQPGHKAGEIDGDKNSQKR